MRRWNGSPEPARTRLRRGTKRTTSVLKARSGTDHAMFIETESTPNPATLKFIPGREVMGARGTADFASPEAAARSPLAARIFALPGVSRVFLGYDFVTVTQNGDADWQGLRPQVLSAVMDHFLSGLPVLEGSEDAGA